eukprot:Hpha_TRINITY_DN15735_c5_g6::TRINITY_DN15735_c5_g6_i1::g.42009::m.42009
MLRVLPNAVRRGVTPVPRGPQRRTYYWWDSHDSLDDFKAKMVFVFKSEGVINPEDSVERLMKYRHVHSFRDFAQHNICSLRFYVKPSGIITRLYRRIQREVGNEVSAGGRQEGPGRDAQNEADDGRMTNAGLQGTYRGVTDPRMLRYTGPNAGNFKTYHDPDHFNG